MRRLLCWLGFHVWGEPVRAVHWETNGLQLYRKVWPCKHCFESRVENGFALSGDQK